MKNLMLLFIAFLLFSCSKDEPEQTCFNIESKTRSWNGSSYDYFLTLRVKGVIQVKENIYNKYSVDQDYCTVPQY